MKNNLYNSISKKNKYFSTNNILYKMFIYFCCFLILSISAIIISYTHHQYNLNDSLHLLNVQGHLPDLLFNLQSSKQKHFCQSQVTGKVTLLYFGYTNCPDACPSTILKLIAIIKKLGPLANKICILFVTVDPINDTPLIIQNYLKRLGVSSSNFIGLSGSFQEIKLLAKKYRVVYKEKLGEKYEIMHSTGIYIFDSQRKIKFIATTKNSEQIIFNSLIKLLSF